MKEKRLPDGKRKISGFRTLHRDSVMRAGLSDLYGIYDILGIPLSI
jgi:hypothetical protein